jgi:hypothetical protein
MIWEGRGLYRISCCSGMCTERNAESDKQTYIRNSNSGTPIHGIEMLNTTLRISGDMTDLQAVIYHN